MRILVPNIGSTSFKYRLFDFGPEWRGGESASGILERVDDHRRAVDTCLEALVEDRVLAGPEDLSAVGFKAVLADGVTGCVRIDDDVLAAMERSAFAAPAHNPSYLLGMRLFAERLPGVPLVALFETAFYQWMPDAATRYAVPGEWHRAGIRRHGFHGASHNFVAERTAEILGRQDVVERVRGLYADGRPAPVKSPPLRVISCHLGGSSSVTGIRNGLAIGSSMGYSPQSGLPQNNRVGDLDPFAVLQVMRMKGWDADRMARELCSQAGIKGISGGIGDMRDIESAADAGSLPARQAMDFLVYETRRWMGSFHLLLGGIDALAFTGGIGENRASIRESICRRLDGLGIRLDVERNLKTVQGTEGEIGAEGSRVRVLVIPAGEELVVASEVARFLEEN